MSHGTVRLVLFLFLGFAFTGCAGTGNNQGVKLPGDARLLAYGRYIPATYVPEEPGLLYFVDQATGQVVYVLSASTRRAPGPLSAEQLPESMKSTFDQNKQYRVYFVPQASAPTSASPAAH